MDLVACLGLYKIGMTESETNNSLSAMSGTPGKVVVVTGASSGIGRAIVTLLVRKDMTVVGLARNMEKMLEMKRSASELSSGFHPLQVDLTKTNEVRDAFAWIRRNFGRVNVLVNNAGCMAIGKLTEGDPDAWRYTFELNVVGLTTCAQEVVRIMLETEIGDGLIINMNSTAGHQVPFYVNPRLNVYPASKFALSAVNETLRQELRFAGSRIRVTSISPGYVDTGFALRAKDAEDVQEEIAAILGQQPSLTPEDIAETVSYIISLSDRVQIDEIILTAV